MREHRVCIEGLPRFSSLPPSGDSTAVEVVMPTACTAFLFIRGSRERVKGRPIAYSRQHWTKRSVKETGGVRFTVGVSGPPGIHRGAMAIGATGDSPGSHGWWTPYRDPGVRERIHLSGAVAGLEARRSHTAAPIVLIREQTGGISVRTLPRNSAHCPEVDRGSPVIMITLERITSGRLIVIDPFMMAGPGCVPQMPSGA